MSLSDVVVVDYGLGNLLSVRRGLEFCGGNVTVSADPEVILDAPRVLLPGVGAFANGMGELQRMGLDEVVLDVARRGTTLLGICLGMQLLFEGSDEFGATSGLGLISGRVVAVPVLAADGTPQKIPHIGWSALTLPSTRPDWKGTILEDTACGDAAYFVHSFMAQPAVDAECLAECEYGGGSISAAVIRDNVMGCQFHPEKSGEVGLKVLRRFLSL